METKINIFYFFDVEHIFYFQVALTTNAQLVLSHMDHVMKDDKTKCL